MVAMATSHNLWRIYLIAVTPTIDHFTVADLVTWPLNGSEAGVDLDTDLTAFIVQIKLFLC